VKDSNRPDEKSTRSLKNESHSSRRMDVLADSELSTSGGDRLCAELDSGPTSHNPLITAAMATPPTQESSYLLVQTRLKGRRHLARSNMALLPYEAAQLAASSSSPKPRFALTNAIPLRLTAAATTAFFAVVTVVWSMQDLNTLGPTGDVSVAKIDAPTIGQLHVTPAENFLTSTTDGPSERRSGTSSAAMISKGPNARDAHDWSSPDTNQSPPFSNAQKSSTHATTSTANPEDSKDHAIPHLAVGGPPATLIAAAGSGSGRYRLDMSPSTPPSTLQAENRTSSGNGKRQNIFQPNMTRPVSEAASPARPLHKPSLKPLELAQLAPPAELPASFRPAVKFRDINEQGLQKAVPLASLDVVDQSEKSTTLERFWGTLVEGVAGALRNRDTSFQMVLKADSNDDDGNKHTDHGSGHDHYDG